MSEGRLLTVDGVADEAVRALGYLPPALAAWFAELNLDLVNHHKRATIKHHGFVAGDRASRFIASRMFGYGAKVRSDRVTSMDDVQGESFLASRTSREGEFPLDEKSLLALEQGASINTTDRMAIPIGRGRPFKGVFQNVPLWRRSRRGLDVRDFDIVPDPDNRGRSFIVDARESSIRRAAREGRNGDDLVVGVLVRRRRQEPKLQFMRQYERILPKHLAKYGKAIDEAATLAGRQAQERRVASILEDRAVYRQAFAEALSRDPGKYAGARRTARAAAREARKARVAG